MSNNGYQIFNHIVYTMEPEQIELLKINMLETFPEFCMSKEASFDMQNMIK